MDNLDFVESLKKLGIEEQAAENLKRDIHGSDFMNLVTALQTNNTKKAEEILIKYGIKMEKTMTENDFLSAKFESLKSGETLDETFGVMKKLGENFSYAIEVSESNRDKILDWLDENEISYQATSPLHYSIDCGDRDIAYRTGRALSNFLGKSTVRDSVDAIRESYKAEISFTIDEVDDRVASMMKRLVKEYQNHVTTDRTIPSGPDTSKFSTTQQGTISYVKGQHVAGGTYGFSRSYEHFVKVGGAVDYKIERQMKNDFLMMVSNLTDEGEFNEDDVLVTADGYKVRFGKVSGSAWGGFGLWYEKPAIRVEEKMSKKHKQRAKDAKDKIDNMKPRNVVATAASMRSGAGPHKKDPRKEDEFGRKTKHKPRFDEGVMGMTKMNSLYRLRELAGLPAGEGIEISEVAPIDMDGPLAPGTVDLNKLDENPATLPDMGAMDDMMDDPIIDIEPGMDDSSLDTIDDIPADIPVDVPVEEPMGTDLVGAPVDQSDAMINIINCLNQIQDMLSDIRLAEYRSLIQHLEDLTNQAQAMGKSYLGEGRRKK